MCCMEVLYTAFLVQSTAWESTQTPDPAQKHWLQQVMHHMSGMPAKSAAKEQKGRLWVFSQLWEGSRLL